MGKLYCEAKFWRPTGLGNRLFSWARCEIFSGSTGAKMLDPRWAHLRGASIIRGGINYAHAYRKILLFDNFKPAPSYVGGLAKYLVRRNAHIVPVNNLTEAFSVYRDGNRQATTLYSFAGDKDHVFDDLRPYHAEIFSALRRITKEKWLKHSTFGRPFIGINIRLGRDFGTAAGSNDFLTGPKRYLRTPLKWYIESLRLIRGYVGADMPAVVVSDGTRAELQELLKEPDVFYPESKSAVGDLLSLSNARFLIGSGRSSFSAWASFLGQMPTVTIPGSSLQSFSVSDDIQKHYVEELDPGAPDEYFIDVIKKIMNAAKD